MGSLLYTAPRHMAYLFLGGGLFFCLFLFFNVEGSDLQACRESCQSLICCCFAPGKPPPCQGGSVCHGGRDGSG